MNKKLDVVIPVYKAHNTIVRLMGSLITQKNKDDLHVYIVNDVCPEGDYQEVVNSFSPYIQVEELKMKKNGGPGVARQMGIDKGTSPFFTCIDADDTLANPFALDKLVSVLDDPTYVMSVGTWYEEREDGSFLKHEQDMVWMFGKVYRRSFIDKYDVRFNETRANEDNGFNTMIRLLVSENEKINFLGDVVYYWHYKEDSITRINNAEYSYNQSFPGYTDNMIYAIKKAKKQKPFNEYINLWAVNVMAQLYLYYYQTVARDKRFIEQNYAYCKKYYDEVFKDYKDGLYSQSATDIFSEVMMQQAANNKGVVPDKTIYQFIEELAINKNDVLHK